MGRQAAQTTYDVIIVGARIAGSTLAALLGDAGYRVLVLDRAAFPSSTLSTHFFRGAGMGAVLERLDILPEVLRLDAPPLVREYRYVPTSMVPSIGPPQAPGDLGYCLSVRREPLDALLVQRAQRAPGVTFRERTRVTKLLWFEGRVCGVEMATPEGPVSAQARVVVGADGRHSFVARAVGASSEEEEAPLRALYYCYVRNFASPDALPPAGPEFSLLDDEVAYVFPSDAGVTCVAISIHREAFATFRRSVTTSFRERLSRHGALASRFAAAEPVSAVLGSGPEPNYVRVPAGPGWALVGDAGLHQDPWSGQGMDMAGTHAIFLAEALDGWLSGRTFEVEALATYHQRRNRHALDTYRQTVRFGRDLRQAQ